MKKALGVLLVLVVAVGLVVWYFVSFKMDATIEKTIEKHASASLGTQVSVGGVKSDIKGGSLSISNITVANPPGFTNQNAFSLNDIEAAIDYANFDIKRIVINKPEIVIEEMGGKTNFDQIMASLNQSEPAPESEAPAEGGEAGEEEQIYVIRHFRMNESRASFESESLDRYSDLKVDSIELNNVKGTRSEVGKIIASEIVSEITKEAATEMLKAKASEKISDIFGKDKD